MPHKSYEVMKDPMTGVEIILKKDTDVGIVLPPQEAGEIRFYDDDFRPTRKEYEELLARVIELEAKTKPPLDMRMAQLKSGLNILTKFANELQVDIDKARGLDGPAK